MNRPLLSVIIPVYKVERYIRECVGSVLDQEYENIEILLIDDGSPDKCPIICEEFKKNDKRVSVIHQKNQGLSMARNNGILQSHGDYITFLDSDDLIHKSTYDLIMRELLDKNIDIAIYGVNTFQDGETVNNKSTINSIDIDILSVKEVISKYMYDRYDINVISCNKIFKRNLFMNNLFPKGKLFEDFVPVSKAILSAQSIIQIHNKMYYYRKREDSINGVSFSQNKFDKSVLDLSDAIDEVIKIIESFDSKLLDEIIPACINSKTSIINQMVLSKYEDTTYVKTVQNMIIKHIWSIIKNKGLYRSQKIKMLSLLDYSLYKRLYPKIKTGSINKR